MKLLSSIVLLGSALPSIAAPTVDPHRLAGTSPLILQLSSESYQAREDAMRQLWSKGEENLAVLKLAASSSDPELSMRATNLVRNIEAGILPTTDKSVVRAIDLYRSGQSLRGKTKALNELIELKALKQVLYLLHWEQDDKIKQALNSDSRIKSVGLAAAHGMLKNGDTQGAIEILKIAPNSVVNQRGLAHLLKYTGQIDTEIEKNSKDLNSDKSIAWQFILLSSKGDTSTLGLLAKTHANKGILATIALIDGNPYPVLSALRDRSSDDIQSKTLEILERFYKTGNPNEVSVELSKLAGELDPLANGGKDLSYLVSAAMLMGDRKLGEELLSQQDRETNLEYYSVQEYSEKEFALLGSPNPVTEPTVFEKWLTSEIKRELDEELGLLDDQESKIEQVAEFFGARGEKKMVLEILQPLVAALADRNSDRWYDLLVSLPIMGMKEQAIQLALEREGDIEVWKTLSHTFFGNVQEINSLWSEVKSLRPDSSDREQFIHVLSVMGMQPKLGSGDKNLEMEIYQKALKFEGAEYLSAMETLAFAAEKRGDITSTLKYYKELSSDSNYPLYSNYLANYRQFAQIQSNWLEIVNSFELDPSAYQNSTYNLTTYGIAKRKIGQQEEGDELLKRALIRTLGTTKTLNYIAGALHEAGYREEARDLWLNLFLQSDTDDWDFFYTLNFINNQSRYHIREEKWRLASAFYLVEKAIYLDPQVHGIQAYRLLHKGHLAHFTQGMSLLESGDRNLAIKVLGYAHDSILGNGSLADNFFPSLIGKGLNREVDTWFSQSWSHVHKEIETYPKDHNARNTAAWLGARNLSHLDESLKHSKIALKLQSNQPAYLDTLAEIYFAKRDRGNAVKQSGIALKSLSSGAYGYTRAAARAADMYNELLQQNQRFHNEPFPGARN